MTQKQTFKILLDLVMTISMPVLMAYERVTSVVYEWLGLVVFLLFLAHHGLNLDWHRTIGKGRYNALRRVSLIDDLLLDSVMILLPISGLLLSEHAASFLSAGRGIGTAGVLHLALNYWGYVMMGFHIGLHGNWITGWPRGKKADCFRLMEAVRSPSAGHRCCPLRRLWIYPTAVCGLSVSAKSICIF